MNVPEPTMCPDCRMQRRFAFRNFFNLYHRKCDLTGKPIISMYDENTAFPVYEMNEWWGDKWNALACGRDIDFNRPIFEQVKELYDTVPRMNIVNSNCENSEYSNLSLGSRNTYMIFGNSYNEDCCYGHIVWQSKNCFDCLYTYKSELCYECVDCVRCNNLHFSLSSDNCSDSKFLVDCTSCRDCFGCVGLKNKEYHIFNESHNKVEYETKMKEFHNGNQQMIKMAKKKVVELREKEIVKFFHGFGNENISGDYLYNCKNAFNSYDLKNCENVRYCATLDNLTNSYDCNFSVRAEWSYNCVTGIGYNLIGCHLVANDSANMYYSDNCYSCKNCFGCVGLKSKKYCVLNKQYSKEDYEVLVPKIIEHMQKTGEWGEFFPATHAPFAYNETMAQEYFPLTKKEALLKGYRWKDADKKDYQPQTYIFPDDINDVLDDIAQEILACADCGKNYKIISQELKFYRNHNLPIPRKCFSCRHKNRMALRNPRHLWGRKCDKCGVDIKTTYPTSRPEKIYCEPCYQESLS